MKKFLLVSVCLLALTACSQGQQGKGTTAASSKQEATQTKKEQVQNKTFVSDLGDHHQNKIQIGYKKDEIFRYQDTDIKKLFAELWTKVKAQ